MSIMPIREDKPEHNRPIVKVKDGYFVSEGGIGIEIYNDYKIPAKPVKKDKNDGQNEEGSNNRS